MKNLTIVALVVMMLLSAALPASAAIQATSVEIRGSVVEDNVGGPHGWDNATFAGFFFDIDDGLGTETLNVTTSGTGGRSIEEDQLTYTTHGQQKQLKVVEAKYAASTEAQLLAAGLEEFGAGKMATSSGNFTIIGWMAEKYVAIKQKDNKLSKLLVEHGTSSSEKKTLTVGETWDLGGGYTVTANSIDAKADPRQVWLTLNKDGVKMDDKVVTSGTSGEPIYTYTVDSLCGENDVPILVTYVDSIFAGATTDMVQFRYTWLINPTCTEVKSGDVFGSMKVSSTNNPLRLNNSETTLTLSRDSTVDIMGNMKFKVADSNDTRFYPMVEYVIGPSEGGEVTGTPTVTTGTPKATTPANATNVTAPTPPPAETTAVVAGTTAVVAQTTKKTEPGFEAIFAIAGLLAVAFFVLRQRK